MTERTQDGACDRPEATGRRTVRRFRALRLGAAALGLAAVAWAVGLAVFVQAIPREVAEPGRDTDAIVVLTGGSNRIDVGIRLLRRGQAARMLVSGVDRAVSERDIRHLLESGGEALPNGLMDCCVQLGYGAEDTVGNALETARWMRDGDMRSLRLVTSNYHMRRSLLELRHALPGVEIVPHPVVPSDVRLGEWWAWPGTLRLLVVEYNKFLAAYARITLG